MEIEKLGVIGAGQMGAGIAQVAAMAGIEFVIEAATEREDRKLELFAKLDRVVEKKDVLATCLAIMEVLHQSHGDKCRPCPLLRQYVDAGWLGRKAKRGFFDYRKK